ncbi:MAG: hypothetical protein K2H46_01540, partial [Muribaculaceae bacterium]|nr:hypothetical protein [Muribaculaceae bacterium]
YSLAIVYINQLTKRFSIELKRLLIKNGFSDKEIYLDLQVYKNDCFDIKRYTNALKYAKHSIIILEVPLINRNDSFFKRIWKPIMISRSLIHPIILGEIKDYSNFPKALKKKKGEAMIYPAINLCNHEFDISKLNTAIKSNISPKQKIYLKIFIYVYTVLVLLFIIMEFIL